MFALLVEFLVYLFAESIFSLVIQVPFEYGIRAYQESFERNNRDPVQATLGYAVFGGLAGFVWVLLQPEPLLPGPMLPGASLVISPILVGFAMQFWGRRRRRNHYPVSNLATFHGGAGFAFGVALVRFLFVG